MNLESPAAFRASALAGMAAQVVCAAVALRAARDQSVGMELLENLRGILHVNIVADVYIRPDRRFIRPFNEDGKARCLLQAIDKLRCGERIRHFGEKSHVAKNA